MEERPENFEEMEQLEAFGKGPVSLSSLKAWMGALGREVWYSPEHQWEENWYQATLKDVAVNFDRPEESEVTLSPSTISSTGCGDWVEMKRIRFVCLIPVSAHISP